MSTPLLDVKGLGIKVEERWLVRNLDFSVFPGQFLAITGSSGSGKTTLLRTLFGELPPEEGSVEKNHLVKDKSAMIFQDLRLAGGATAVTNVLGGSLRRHKFLNTLLGFPVKEKEEASKLLCRLGLQDKFRQWTSTLSRGEKQRVAICRSLLSHPLMLLADEPVSSLDSDWADQILAILRKESLEKQGCLVCTLHNENQVSEFADLELHIDEKNPTQWDLKKIGRKI